MKEKSGNKNHQMNIGTKEHALKEARARTAKRTRKERLDGLILQMLEFTNSFIVYVQLCPSLGRGGSSIRGKSNGAKVSAPLPLNLPSRRHEKGGHDVSLVSSCSSWGSPSALSTAVLGSTSSTGSSPTADGTSPLLTTAPQGQASDSPQPDTQGGSPFQKATPRAWGAVAQTSDSNLAEYPTAAEAAKKAQEHQGNG